jgi:hypothetical protein
MPRHGVVGAKHSAQVYPIYLLNLTAECFALT